MEIARPYDYLFRVVLLGESGTDKFGLIKTFCQQSVPNPSVFTIGAAFVVRTIELDSKRIQLQFWDTAGSERFHTMAPLYFRGAHGIMVVYDVTNRTSFESISQRFKQAIHEKKHKDAVVMMVGNKCHLENLRQVSIEEGRRLAEELGYLFFEVSSEMDVNVEPAFVTLAQAIKEKIDQ